MRYLRLAVSSVWGLVSACAAAPSPTAEDPSAPASATDGGLPMAPSMGDEDGTRLQPEEGGFSVVLPPDAAPPARSVEGDNHLAWEIESPGLRLSVEVIHVPGGIMNTDEFVERMRTRVAETGRVLERSEGGPEGHPGWAMRLTGVDPDPRERIEVALAVTPRRAFLLMAAAEDSARLDSPEVRAFFTGFRAVQTTGLSREIRSAEGGFEATFPPACGPAFKRVEIVDHKVHLSWVSEGEGQAQCMVALTRVDPLPTDEVLSAAVAGATRALPGAQVDATDDSMLRGVPRRSVRMQASVDGVRLHMRADFSYVDRALYQLQFVSPDPDELDAPEVRAFFDSLRVSQ